MSQTTRAAAVCATVVAVLVAVIPRSTPTAARPNQPPTGVSAVAVRGDRIVAAVDDQLVSLLRGANDPRELTVVGRAGLAPPPASGYGLALHPDGTVAAVADSTGVALVAFGAGGDPVITRVEGDLLDAGARAVAFAGPMLVTLAIRLWEGSAGEPVAFTLRTYDVGDMRAPRRVGDLTWRRPTGSGATLAGFAASERAAYIGLATQWSRARSGHVEIVDLGEPAMPRPLPVFWTGGHLRSLAIDGTSLWVATATGSSENGAQGADGVQRYDTSDPANPVARGWVALEASPVRVAASGVSVCVALVGTPPPAGRLIGIDAADPARPRLIENGDRDLAAAPTALDATGEHVAYGDAAGRVAWGLLSSRSSRCLPGPSWPDDGRPGPYATALAWTPTPSAASTPRPTLDPSVFVGRLWLPALLRGGWVKR